MTTKFFARSFLSLFLIASISLLNVNIVLADDPTPPPATVEPTQPPTEEPTQQPEESAVPTATDNPTVEDSPSDGEQAPAEQEATVSGPLSEIPENTDIVVLDENGDPLPLVSQAAIDAILEDDPMWCPGTSLPGSANCISFTGANAITNLLADMRNNTTAYDENGIIYFTTNPGNGSFSLTNAAASLGTTDFNTLSNFNLVLQGGWNGANGAGATFTGQTNFGNNSFTIGTTGNPWVGNITMNNFTFSGVSTTNAVSVYTTSGNIVLSNVDVTQQSGDNYTANLQSNSGNISVQNGSSFDGNNSGSNQNRGFRAATNTGSITITGTSGSPITFTDANGCGTLFGFCLLPTLVNYNGATLSAPTVSLNYVSSSNNDLNGIQITNANTVILNQVSAINNGTNLLLSPDSGDVGAGVLVSGTGSTLVNLTGGIFNGNERYGIEINNGSITITTLPTCNNNDLGCINDTVPPVLTLPGNIIVEATSSSGATVSYTASATDAIAGPVAISCAPSSGSTFVIGTTTVNCSASDLNGNTSSGSFNITVRDSTAPVLSLPANIVAEATSPSGNVISYSVTATDLISGSRPVTCNPPSGSTFAIGTTTVNCSSTDTYGNTGTGSFTVTVQDTTAPILTLPANMTVEATSPTGASVTYSASASDVIDGLLLVSCSSASGSTFAFGLTTVNCSATDAHNNITNGSFTVTVQDTTPPVIAPVADIQSSLQNIFGSKQISFTLPKTTDAVDGTGTALCSPVSGSSFKVGDWTVTCKATDAHGNVATPVTFTIHIQLVAGSQITTTSIIPITGGETFELDCNTEVMLDGTKVVFYNLCDQQASLTSMDANNLPGNLPAGFTFVTGLNVNVLDQGQGLDQLPANTGVEMDFPISNPGQFAVLFWDNGQWVEITQSLNEADVAKALTNDTSDELYKLLSSESGKYKTLTTENTGIFVLVKK